MRTSIILSLILILSGAATAQNISSGNFQWTVTSAKAPTDTNAFDYSCVFKTTTNNTLDWLQNGGQVITHFTVTSVDGQWSDISTDGQVTYNVQNGKITGTIRFQRSSGVPQIQLQLSVSGTPDQDYVFSVSSITPVN